MRFVFIELTLLLLSAFRLDAILSTVTSERQVYSKSRRPFEAQYKYWEGILWWLIDDEAGNNFPYHYTKPLEQWSDRLEHVASAAWKDPCKADLIMSIEGTNGYAAAMNNFMNDLWLATYTNSSVALCQGERLSNIWEQHFENPLNIPICRSEECAENEIWYDGGKGWAAVFKMAEFDRDYLLASKRMIYHKALPYKAETGMQIQNKLTSLGLDDGEFVAVHVRRGDKWTEAPPVPTKAYAEITKQQLHNLSASNVTNHLVFCASDDVGMPAELQDSLNTLGSGVNVVHQSLEAGTNKRGDIGEDSQAVLELLTDIEALQRARVFIGTSSSNIGRLVFYCQQPSSAAISLDGDHDYLTRNR